MTDLKQHETKLEFKDERKKFLVSSRGDCWMHPDTLEVVNRRYFSKLYTEKEMKEWIAPLFDNKGKRILNFKLADSFIRHYETIKPDFGFGGMSELVLARTYSRVVTDENGEERNEAFYEIVRRVVEGAYNIQKRHVLQNGGFWDDKKAALSATEMYDRIFRMKFLPPGRGLWAMGSKITEKAALFSALNNCAFDSTDSIGTEGSTIFARIMDFSMLGIGMGFDVLGAGMCAIYMPHPVVEGEALETKAKRTFVVGDSREGWVASTVALLETYMSPDKLSLQFDYSRIRPEGERLVTFGGVAPGPDPLSELHDRIREQLLKCCMGSFDLNDELSVDVQPYLGIEDITNIANMIGKCVFSGNVRRSAEIAFGPKDSEEYLDLKDFTKNPHRAAYGWLSNNSIFAELGMDYTEAAKRTYKNGEPGYFWLENAQKHGRMSGKTSDRARAEPKAAGGNPCLEQTLEKKEVCNLVEMILDRHNDIDDFCVTLKYAYLFAKTVSLCHIHWKDTDAIVQRNRRIGTSMTGIVQCITRIGQGEFIEWCERGYKTLERWDFIYSKWFRVSPSVKLTSVKPSGTVSLLSGSTPGIHAPISTRYVRRITIPDNSPLLPALINAGYPIVKRKGQNTSCLAEFPVKLDDCEMKTQREESYIDVLNRAVLLQKHWADNQVSVTVTFDPETTSAQDLADALDIYQYSLKGVSFLPSGAIDQYEYPPYEDISEEEYMERASVIQPIDWNNTVMKDPEKPSYCTNEGCMSVGQ